MRIYQRIQNPDATWFLFDLFFDRPSLPLRFYRVLTTGWRCRSFLHDHCDFNRFAMQRADRL